MKILFCFLLCGLTLATACHEFSEEIIIPPQQQTPRQSALAQHVQLLTNKLSQFTPSEQEFLEQLHLSYGSYENFLQNADKEEIQGLRKLGKNRLLEDVRIQSRNSSRLLEQSLKAPHSAEILPKYTIENTEGIQSWTCKEWCIIRAEQTRMNSISSCMAEKGDEYECEEEAELHYFYFFTDCIANC